MPVNDWEGNGALGADPGPIVVTNTGSGVTETYSLSCGASSPDGWNPADAGSFNLPGVNIFGLYVSFNGDEPTEAEITAIFAASAQGPQTVNTTPKTCDGTNFVGPDADQDGMNVAAAATQNLWFLFGSPTQTAATAAQGITLTITAQTP